MPYTQAFGHDLGAHALLAQGRDFARECRPAVRVDQMAELFRWPLGQAPRVLRCLCVLFCLICALFVIGLLFSHVYVYALFNYVILLRVLRCIIAQEVDAGGVVGEVAVAEEVRLPGAHGGRLLKGLEQPPQAVAQVRGGREDGVTYGYHCEYYYYYYHHYHYYHYYHYRYYHHYHYHYYYYYYYHYRYYHH